jgi:hypothetical protein
MRLGFTRVAAVHAARSALLLDDDVSTAHDVQAIHVTCRMVYARVSVRTELDDLRPNPQLVIDIEKALSFPEQDKQIDALRSVWRRWGSVMATRIQIGCALVSTSVFAKNSYIPTVSGPCDLMTPVYSYLIETAWYFIQYAWTYRAACCREVCAQCAPYSGQ